LLGLDSGVAKDFRRADRDQQFLLPVDMREWLPDDHVVWALLEVVDRLDISRLEACYALGGAERQAYDPRMLLALLIYAYSDGIRSSRQIERLCRTDVAMRVITGQQVPGHTVIARFRQRHQGLRVAAVHPDAGGMRQGRARAAGDDRDRRHEDRRGRLPACHVPPGVASAAG
jgi:transposase